MKNNKFVLGLLLGLTFFFLMGAFTRDWTESTPTDSTVANQIDDFNRYLRVDSSDRLKNMFYGFIAGENTLSQHAQYIQFYEQASLAQPSAAYGRIGGLAVGGKCELHWRDEDNNLIQFTTAGAIGGGNLQLLAGKDLIGSSTSDITINTNKFTVAGATGNTVIAGTLTQQGVATLADTSALATSGAPAADAQIANKKYVDDQITANANGLCKAWAYVASNGTISASYNVSGVVRNSAGNYTVSWDTDFASSNYATVATLSSTNYNISVDSQATGSIVVKTYSGATPTDNRFNIAAFGAQ